MNLPPALLLPPDPPLVPPPPVPVATRGKRILYLPHKLFVGEGALGAQAHPSIGPDFPQFPLQRPPGLLPLNTVLHSQLHPLEKSAHTTRPNSHTDTAATVLALSGHPETRLVYLVACTSFWDNAIKYASHDQVVEPIAWGAIPANTPPINTWQYSINYVPVPPAPQQALGVKALATWFLSHRNRRAIIPAMTSEPSVQGEVNTQMIEPLNALLKTRYPALFQDNVPQQGAPDPPQRGGRRGLLLQPQLNPQSGRRGRVPQQQGHIPPHPQRTHGSSQQGLTPDDSSGDFPQWAKPCYDLHLNQSPSNAGYPDYLLRRLDDRSNHAAVGEVKAWWSYETKLFDDMFSEDMMNPATGVFEWSSKDIGNKLIKQLWGELSFFGCNFGYVTNGEIVMLFARERDTLIVSEMKDWDDPSVLQALAGLSFAGIDIGYLQPADRWSLINLYLCPEPHRQRSWWW